MKKALAQSLAKKVERLDAFEDRLGVKFENISVKIEEDGWFTLFCELHSNQGTAISDDVTVECVLYDQEGSILGKEDTTVFSDEFFGFEVIELAFQEDDIAGQVGKIRLYPKK